METEDELYSRLIKEAKNGKQFPIQFDGMNCHDFDNGCDGWDGESRRCNCGNRRVYWEISDDKTYVRAVAW